MSSGRRWLQYKLKAQHLQESPCSYKRISYKSLTIYIASRLPDLPPTMIIGCGIISST